MRYTIHTKNKIPFKIKVIKVYQRLRAILLDSKNREVCHWWLTSSNASKRYNPFKPAPSIVHFLVLNKLDTNELQKLYEIMYCVEENDEIVFA